MSVRELPETLLIGGLEHTVRVVSQEILGPDRLAQCNDVVPEIDILEDAPERKRRALLFHEAFEGITNTHFLEIEHMVLSVLAAETLRLLDDNPNLRGYLWPQK